MWFACAMKPSLAKSPANRRVFLQTSLLAAAGAPLVLRAAEPAGARSADDLLAEAREGIQKHRRAKGRSVVLTADGKPVAGAR